MAFCIFGAPADQTDHATRALRAARRLQSSLGELARQYPELDAGIGVSAGSVVAGNVGSERRYEYTVIGDPVNEAARLTELAKGLPERVATSASAIMRAGSEGNNWRMYEMLVLRGRGAETSVYVPKGLATSDSEGGTVES
jgi:adenylate cyclase